MMSIFHYVVPGHRRKAAAGHAIGRAVVVIAEPDAAHEVASVAHEPGVAVAVGGSGLAGGGDAVEASAAAGAIFNHAVYHLDHIGGDPRGQDPARPLARRGGAAH